MQKPHSKARHGRKLTIRVPVHSIIMAKCAESLLFCYSRPKSPSRPSHQLRQSPSKAPFVPLSALEWKSTQASSQAFAEASDAPRCAFCEGEAMGFCVGCLAVRYCEGCFEKEHGKKAGLHLFCSYSSSGVLKWNS